ncbi:MAG: ComEC family competence protein [Saprospiraceae bacterium]|nr:ComEC family competence protein [Saprospiraceae bacterium]
MKAFFRQHPLLRITIAYMAGCFMASQLGLLPPWLLLSGVGLCLSVSWFLPAILSGKYSHAVAGLFLVLASICLGAGLYIQCLPEQKDHHYEHFLTGYNDDFLLVVEEVNKKRLIGAIRRVNEHERTTGRLVLYIDTSDTLNEDLVDDLVCFKGRATRILPPKNPASFDFQKFYRNKHIYHQCFIQSEDWSIVSENHRNSVGSYLRTLRSKAKGSLQEHVTSDHAFALVSALLLGDKRSLDEDMRNAYSDTGSMHVLAVSGLHVGVLFLILSFLFRGIAMNHLALRILRSVLILLGVWAFAYLAGGSNSVIRAATMFTFFEGGLLLGRGQYSVNTLSIAAFMLLLVDPFSLFDVGFQLSFAAVLGIILLQRAIERTWIIENLVGHKIWKLVSLSLAAQLFTFPFIIYYFHQFPLYFWLSGIFTVPAAFLLLTAGFTFLLLQWVPVVGILLGGLLHSIAKAMNFIVFLLQKLPYVEVDGLWPDAIYLLLIVSAIALFTAFLRLKRTTYLVAFLSVFLLTLVYRTNALLQRNNQTRLVYYFISGDSYGELFVGRNSYPLMRKQMEEKTLKYVIRNCRDLNGIDTVHNGEFVMPYQGHLQLGQTILYLSELDERKQGILPDVDITIIGQSFNEYQLEKTRPSQLYVLDGTLTFSQATKWEQLLKQRNRKVHNMWTDGAYVLELTEEKI